MIIVNQNMGRFYEKNRLQNDNGNIFDNCVYYFNESKWWIHWCNVTYDIGDIRYHRNN